MLSSGGGKIRGTCMEAIVLLSKSSSLRAASAITGKEGILIRIVLILASTSVKINKQVADMGVGSCGLLTILAPGSVNYKMFKKLIRFEI